MPAVPFVHAAHLPIDLFKFVFGELRNLFNQMQSIIKFMADRSPDRDRPQLVLPEKAGRCDTSACTARSVWSHEHAQFCNQTGAWEREFRHVPLTPLTGRY